MNNSCLAGIGFAIMIMLAFLFVCLIAILLTITIGSLYGFYCAAVCYTTALKRTYGSDKYYEAGAGLKAIVLLVLLIGVFIALIATGTVHINQIFGVH